MDGSWLGLSGRTALVAGGTRNIGRAVAEGLAEAGADVAVIGGSDKAALDDTLQALAGHGVRCTGVLQPLDDAPGVDRTVQQILTELGHVDILVNVAAVRPAAAAEDITVEDWDAVMAVNLRGPFQLAQAVLPGMKVRGFGRIINFSGINAYWGRTARAHVVTTKGGIVGLSRALAKEYATDGITVNTVVPGTIDTVRHTPEWYPDMDRRWAGHLERVPMARMGTMEEVVSVVLFVASSRSSYLTGHEFFVTGGSYPLVRDA